MKERILKAAWFTPAQHHRWGLPLLIVGKPGIAKSAIIEATARASRLDCEVVIASLREPADFLGLPIPRDGAVEYAPPAWARRVADAKRAVVFLDEIGSVPPSVQSALLRVILDRVVGDLVLPPSVRFTAAMNPVAEAAGGWDLAPPMANRFAHLAWDPPAVADWTGWLLTQADNGDGLPPFDPAAEEARVMAEWPGGFARARGLVAGFIRSRPDLLFNMPAVGTPGISGAWPSPRSWEGATRAVAAARIHQLDEVEQDELIGGFVGQGPATELQAYARRADLPDPADLLDGKVVWQHDPDRLDRTYAVLAGCGALIGATADVALQKERARVLWGLLGPIVEQAADLTVPCIAALTRARQAMLPEATPVLIRANPALRAANVMAR